MNSPAQEKSSDVLRMKVVIRGAVQGVGFRPYIYKLATQLKLRGWVSNSSLGVLIDVEGSKQLLDQLLVRIEKEKPLHSFIQGMEVSFLDSLGYTAFEIRESNSNGEKQALVLADIATCPECLAEIFDVTNRRYLYPFTNCTQCGPRFSIIESLPYDRINTTMKKFDMCDECQREYTNPLDRRFHAQPNACPRCGPHLELWNSVGDVLASRYEGLLKSVDDIRAGKIVAIKGVGGFHLIVDASNEAAVARLRVRKRREEKPLAVMFPSIELLKQECEVSELEERLLKSSESPIVLLRRKLTIENCPLNIDNSSSTMVNGQCSVFNGQSAIAGTVAPNNPYLGAMLPYTPLHQILMQSLGIPIVATSGNLSDEPICIDEHEALTRLKDVADVFLVHNRPIVRHVDDSVVRVLMGREQIIRRARGYAPLPITLKNESPPMIAVGAHQKNAVAVTSRRNVFISQHIGDLETKEAFNAFTDVVHDLRELFDVKPECVIADMHPDYLSTQFATKTSLPVTHIQHHYAHVASCMAENELEGCVLGVSWDGTGYGLDGTIWGGEFLVTNASSFTRAGSFRSFRLPGSAKAAKEPRRSALGLLHGILGDALFDMNEMAPVASFSKGERSVLRQMLTKQLNSPMTSSVGRIFDAVASIINLRQRVSYEGQAAMELEFAIQDYSSEDFYEYRIETAERNSESILEVDWAPMVVNILHDVNKGIAIPKISSRFHNTLVEILIDVAKIVGAESVVLTGGCFQNKYLTERSALRLQREGFRPYWHQRVPTNDGGIAFGQIVGATRLRMNFENENETTTPIPQNIHQPTAEVHL